MKKMNKSTLLAPTLFVGMCLAAGAQAQDVTYYIANAGGASTPSGYQYLDNFTGSIDGAGINNALVGGISIQEVGGPTPGLPTSYVTVCTDINASVYLGQTYTYQGPTAFTKLTGVAPSWGSINTPSYVSANGASVTAAAIAMQNAAWLFYNEGGTAASGYSLASMSSVDAMAGLQLAIWEALYDSTGGNQAVVVNGSSRFNVTGYSDTAEQNDAAADIAALNAILGTGAGKFDDTAGTIKGSLLFPDPDTTQGNGDGELVQELLIGTGGPNGVIVPEASTLVAGMLVLLPAGVSTLQILRKKRSAQQ